MTPRDASGLIDRMVAGERLSADETQRLEEAKHADPACAREVALLDELAGFVDARGGPPSAASIAIAHAALARARQRGSTHPAAASRSRRAVPIALVSLAAAAIAVLAWSWPRDQRSVAPPPVASARLSIAVGEVTLDGHAIGETPPRITASTTVAVRDGRACLAIDPSIDVCLDASTTASVSRLGDPQTLVEVHRGHAVARLDPLGAGRSFALGAADVRIVAVGTIFSIDVADDGVGITAAVLEGVVEIATGDTTLRLEAHEVARLGPGVVERGRLSASAESRDLELLSAVPDHDGAIGYVAIEVSPAGAQVFVDDRSLGASPLVVALGVGDHRLELRGADGARLGETLSVQTDALVTRRFALTATDAPAPAAPEVPALELPTPALEDHDDVDIEIDADAPARPRAAVPSPRALLAEARTLRREDRWGDAADAYRRLLREHPRSSEAHTALVSLGDLLLDRLDQPEQAARAYLRYVRDGGGVLAPEARWGIIRARRKQGDARAEKRAIEEFRRHHPDDARVDSLR